MPDETPCPLCASRSHRGFPIHYAYRNRVFRGAECRDCGMVFLVPRPDASDLQAMYGEEYFEGGDALHGAHSSTDYETAAREGAVKFPEILGWIRRYRPSGDFLEIGCGMGYFLDFARRHGYRTSGLEFSETGTRAARDQFGLDVRQGSLDTVALPRASYDVVFLGDVLEHLVEPREALVQIHSLLRPGGIVAAEVPSQFNALVGRGAVAVYRRLGRTRDMRLPPYHVNEFLPGTLRRILERAGYGDVRVVQRVKPPDRITLRGSWFDRAAKKSLQYPNYWITRATGTLGDRLLGIGVKGPAAWRPGTAT